MNTARWIYNVEPDRTPPGEQRVANLLSNLSDEITVRWGFHYTDSISREGDFVIQGPDGHVLVTEAKSGSVGLDTQTGRWETANGENPFIQLATEWRGVLDLLEDHADKTGMVKPFIDRVLALPDISISPEQTVYQGQPRDRVVAAVSEHAPLVNLQDLRVFVHRCHRQIYDTYDPQRQWRSAGRLRRVYQHQARRSDGCSSISAAAIDSPPGSNRAASSRMLLPAAICRKSRQELRCFCRPSSRPQISSSRYGSVSSVEKEICRFVR